MLARSSDKRVAMTSRFVKIGVNKKSMDGLVVHASLIVHSLLDSMVYVWKSMNAHGRCTSS